MTTIVSAKQIARANDSAKAALHRHRRRRQMLPARGNPARDAGIYFLTPDYDEPSGGVRVMYRHVDILNSAGVPAAVVHQKPGFSCGWFEHDTTVLDVRSLVLGPQDLLVVPELDVDLLTRLPAGLRHVIFNQNAHFTWRNAPDIVAAHHRQRPELLGLITVSQHGAELLRFAFPGLTTHRVHLGLDPGLFHPPAQPAPARISYMPRRAGEDAGQVLRLLEGRGVLDGWEVRALDGLSHSDVGHALRRSSIYLSFTYQEGFGLPAAEAMACGNYVVGFHGFAGREFFDPAFSAPVETGDVLALAQAVEQAIVSTREDSSWCTRKGLLAAEFIHRNYSLAAEHTDVVAVYQQFLTTESPLKTSAKLTHTTRRFQ